MFSTLSSNFKNQANVLPIFIPIFASWNFADIALLLLLFVFPLEIPLSS